ncbi:conjugative transfer ATPase [Motilimonas cestriensis]|uniref:conjugative transfer ATPase n=1 Tax=Motilimonas cestriensis TaxID=2742685 RepID=UPI003DA34E4B
MKAIIEGVRQALFVPPNQRKSVVEDKSKEDATDETLINHREYKHKSETKADYKRLYRRMKYSFADRLPYMEYLSEHGQFLLEDGFSVAAVYTLKPISTEGRSEEWLISRRDQIQDIFQSILEEYEIHHGQWVMQQFTYDSDELFRIIPSIRDYVADHAKGTQYTEEYLKELEAHLRGVSNPAGIFQDSAVTGEPWRGKVQATKMAIYRRCTESEKRKAKEVFSPTEQLTDICERIEQALSRTECQYTRDTGKDFFGWLLRWFNPNPELTNGDREMFYDMNDYPENEDLPFGTDLAEALLYTPPVSDPDNSCWFFDDMPHRFIRCASRKNTPAIGLLTGEIRDKTAKKGSGGARCMLDRLPEGSITCLTVIIEASTSVESHLNKLDGKSKGETAESSRTQEQIERSRTYMGSNQKVVRASCGVYIRAKNLKELKKRTQQTSQVLMMNGFRVLRDRDDSMQNHAYLTHLPMNFDPAADKRYRYQRMYFAQHAANMTMFFGRAVGTGNAGMTCFNRGGDLFMADPFNKDDRTNNAHGVILGSTGSGKSVFCTTFAAHIMAVHRPRLYLVEAGNSFGLLAQYFERHGLTVQRMSVTPSEIDKGLNFAPFSEAHKAIEQKASVDSVSDEKVEDEVDEQDEKRDVLGELEIIAKLMITGGEKVEVDKFSRADRFALRNCIVTAAEKSIAENRICQTGDIANEIMSLSENVSIPQQERSRLREMGASMAYYTQGLEGKLFNGTGFSWVDADVTIVDLGMLAQEGREAQLAVTYTSLMLEINARAEQYQHTGRMGLMLTDEAHLITANPLLAPFAVKIVKMWRKLNYWWWAATQNCSDFPDSAAKLLKMIEFWICLGTSTLEIEEISEFKTLSSEQQELLLSIRKEPKKYAEGAIISGKIEQLFRSVPPSLFLALAMTEGYEKADRAKLMEEHDISEVDAALMIADQINEARGLRA